MSSIDEELTGLCQALDRALVLMAEAEAASEVVEPVSRWSIAQHLDHSARALHQNFKAIRRLVEAPEPDGPDPGKPTAPRTELAPEAEEILVKGQIPRGVAESPGPVRPDPDPDPDAVAAALGDLRQRFTGLADRRDDLAAARGQLPHPALGPFDAGQWLRFAHVHLLHHLAIIDDIRAARSD